MELEAGAWDITGLTITEGREESGVTGWESEERLTTSLCETKYRVFKKRALQWNSKCYCVASVKKTSTLRGVQTVHRSRCA
jgi:hypothetical protein